MESPNTKTFVATIKRMAQAFGTLIHMILIFSLSLYKCHPCKGAELVSEVRNCRFNRFIDCVCAI